MNTSPFSPVKIKNTGSKELDGLLGSIIGISSIINDEHIHYIVFVPTKLSNGYYSVVLPNCCLEEATPEECLALGTEALKFISGFILENPL